MKKILASVAIGILYPCIAVGATEIENQLRVVAQAGGTRQAGSATGSAELKSRVLARRQLDPGFSLVDDKSKDNRASAIENAILVDRPDDWLKRLEGWGRVGGHATTFQKQAQNATEIIVSEVESFKTPSGATDALRFSKKLAADKDVMQKAMNSLGFQISTIEARQAPFGGSDSVVLYVKGTARQLPAVMVQVMWRKDSLVNSVAWFTIGTSGIFESDVVKLAQTQDSLGR